MDLSIPSHQLRCIADTGEDFDPHADGGVWVLGVTKQMLANDLIAARDVLRAVVEARDRHAATYGPTPSFAAHGSLADRAAALLPTGPASEGV